VVLVAFYLGVVAVATVALRRLAGSADDAPVVTGPAVESADVAP